MKNRYEAVPTTINTVATIKSAFQRGMVWFISIVGLLPGCRPRWAIVASTELAPSGAGGGAGSRASQISGVLLSGSNAQTSAAFEPATRTCLPLASVTSMGGLEKSKSGPIGLGQLPTGLPSQR